MPDDTKQKQHAANIRAEGHIMRQWGITRGQARQRLHDFRVDQDAARQAKAAQQQPPAPPPPPPLTIDVDTTVFNPKPLTLGDSSGPAIKPASNVPNTTGATADIVACRDNGDSTFTQVTLHFVNGLLASVET